MAVIFDKEKQIFSLQTENTTYQMMVYPYGYLMHLYYGAKISEDTLEDVIGGRHICWDGIPGEFEEEQRLSLAAEPQEYPTNGLGDYRISSVEVRNQDGTDVVDLRYQSHEIKKGAYEIPGMPALYGTEEDADTLILHMKDPITGLEADLYYSVWEKYDVIARSVCLKNGGKGVIHLEKALSMNLDLIAGEWEMVHFFGKHAMERQLERTPLIHGVMETGSIRGNSSHQNNPFVMVCKKETNEDYGPCYSVSLVYSGNFTIQAEVDQLDTVRVNAGIHPKGFGWELREGECFHTPQAVMSFSNCGFGKLSSNLHRIIREHIVRGRYQNERRPALINSWEATGFNFEQEKIYNFAVTAAKLGVEMLVLDDGWFGARNNDHCGLGDWVVNEEKLKGGLAGLAERINSLGLKFGIWFEPEMISENSDLFRAHPDWAIRIPGRDPSRTRHQLVLDMGRKEVRDCIYEMMCKVLDSANIEYVKWDMNRNMCDVYSAQLSAECQGEARHRYILGVYDLLERLTSRYPDILWEGCAGGGGRFDMGMLYYFPQIWCSDNTDACDRAFIQYGTSFGYPINTVSAHVSKTPKHGNRYIPIETRGVVAMAGTFGYEMDLSLLSEAEQETVKEQIRTFKEHYELIQRGEYFRLMAPYDKLRQSVWEFAAWDRSEALICGEQMLGEANEPKRRVFPKGLDENKYYEEVQTGRVRKGDAWMNGGIYLPKHGNDYQAVFVYLKEVENKYTEQR